MDAEAQHIRHHEQRRVAQRSGILLQLSEGDVEVLALAFVFPSEVTSLPDIGPTLSAGRLVRSLLEGEDLADRIRLSRSRFIQQSAYVDELLLRGGPLGTGARL